MDQLLKDIRAAAKALIVELRKGDYTLRRTDEEAAVFDSSWEVRIAAFLLAERRATEERCAKLVCEWCRETMPPRPFHTLNGVVGHVYGIHNGAWEPCRAVELGILPVSAEGGK